MRKVLVGFFVIFSIFSIYPLRIYAAADPIAHFKFDDGSGTNPDDSSANNISASFTSTNPTWSTDIPSAITFDDPYSLDFTGNGDGVTVTWPGDLDFGATDPRSFSFWYKPTANGEGQYSRIISWSNDRLEIAGTSASTSTHKIAYFDGNWNDTDITLTLGTWYHVIFTYDGTTARFYIDNELQDEHALAGRSLSGTMRIGNRVQQLDEGINGKIDDVRIYDYALNESQIQNIAEGSNNPDGDPTPTPTPTTAPSTSTLQPASAPTSCKADKPTSSPNLFQISTSPTSATLYFSPVKPLTGYFVSYRTNTDANQHASNFNAQESNGVLSYTVNALSQQSTYYFKIRGINDCVPGEWSQTVKATTTSSNFNPIPTQNSLQLKIDNTPTPTEPSPESQTDTLNEGHNLAIKVVNNNKPVQGATVTLHSVPRQTITDSKGFARFSNVEKGSHTVVLAYDNYSGQEDITVDGEQKDLDINISIELKPESPVTKNLPLIFIILGTIILILVFLLIKRRKQN
jgi:Concanavalin A-like lectin/glucanases superfamily/Carboxypeptidase regulatory-like domain/Fibronectin type III domain